MAGGIARTWHKRLLRIHNGSRGFFAHGSRHDCYGAGRAGGRAVECLDRDDFGLKSGVLVAMVPRAAFPHHPDHRITFQSPVIASKP